MNWKGMQPIARGLVMVVAFWAVNGVIIGAMAWGHKHVQAAMILFGVGLVAAATAIMFVIGRDWP